MKLYTVSVDSRGFSADWNDILIVLAHDEADAKSLAERQVEESRGVIEILSSEAYLLPFTGDARVIGRLLNTDEE